MLTEKQMEAALKLFEKRMQGVTDFYYQRMGEHIRDIGQLAPSDVHRLQQLRRVDKTMAEVKQRLARAAGMSVKDIEKVLEQAARVDDRVVRKITGVDDADVRLASNTALRRALRAQAAETAGLMKNLSKTTATPKAYQKAVDAAVTAVQSGAEDYESAIRRTLRQAGALGLRVRDTGTSAVEYESGHTRRVDTAVRMNILDAMRRMNQRAMEEVGREFGADGVEIDAHMLCAEDHLPYQGQQYTNEEFEEIQESLPRPFGEWNCRHTWAPIIVGVSPRAYTDEDLARFERFSTEEVEIDGRTKTRYEWSQEMRRMETAIRQKKDTATLAAAAGDATLRRECQGSLNAMVKAYERVSDLAGMGPDFRRTYAAGFKDAKVEKELQNGAENGIIESKLARLYNADGTEAYCYPKTDVIQKMTSFDEINEYFSTRDRNGEKEYLFDGLIRTLPLSHQKAIAEAVVYLQENFKKRELPAVIRVQKTASVNGREVVGYYDTKARKIVLSMKKNITEGDFYSTAFHELIHHYDRYNDEADYCVKQAEKELLKTFKPGTSIPYSAVEIDFMKLKVAGADFKKNSEVLAYSVENSINTGYDPNPLAQIVNELFVERNGNS